MLSIAQNSALALCSMLPSRVAERVGDELLRVRLQVAVRVLHQPEVRRLADQHAASSTFSARGMTSLSANTVRLSIRPSSLVSSSTTTRLIGSRESRPDSVGQKCGHLDRPQPAVRIEVDDDRRLDHRLGRDELDVESRAAPRTSVIASSGVSAGDLPSLALSPAATVAWAVEELSARGDAHRRDATTMIRTTAGYRMC